MAFSIRSFPELFGQLESSSSDIVNVCKPLILEPHLKPGLLATSNVIPNTFDTKFGKLVVPRQKNPPSLAPGTARDARCGSLTGYLRSGTIICASDFIGDVAATTGKMSLEEKYDYQTRPLSAFDVEITEDQKSLRSLFYIAVNENELPNFHFWIVPEEVDPVEAARGMDVKVVSKSTSTSPAVAANLGQSDFGIQGSIDSPFCQSFASGPLSSNGKHPLEENVDRIQHTSATSWIQEERDPYNHGPMDTLNFLPKERAKPSHDKSTTTREQAQSGRPSEPLSVIQKKEVLLQFRKGGIYLADFNFQEFVETARKLVEHEEDDPVQGKDMRICVDIQDFSTGSVIERRISSNRKHRQIYSTDVRPYLGQAGFDIRVRSMKMKETPFDDHGAEPTVLKIMHRGKGSLYVHVDWQKGNLKDNDDAFWRALNFLFPEDYKESSPERLKLEIPGHGLLDIDRSSSMAINKDIQARFASITSANQTSRAAEVFVYRVTESKRQKELREKGASQRTGDSKGKTTSPEANNARKTAVAQTQTERIVFHVPGKRQCPFKACRELLDMDKGGSDYHVSLTHMIRLTFLTKL